MAAGKMKFKLETLKDRALQAADERLKSAHADLQRTLDEYEDGGPKEAWRARQEERLSELFRRLGDDGISDEELADFRIERIPTPDQQNLRFARRTVREREHERQRIMAKSDSLVPDADGTISLTKTQLADYFGL